MLYTWDYRQRLTDVTIYGDSGQIKTIHYEYDLFDRLISKTVDTDGAQGSAAPVTTYSVWDDGSTALTTVLEREPGTSVLGGTADGFGNVLPVQDRLTNDARASEIEKGFTGKDLLSSRLFRSPQIERNQLRTRRSRVDCDVNLGC